MNSSSARKAAHPPTPLHFSVDPTGSRCAVEVQIYLMGPTDYRKAQLQFPVCPHEGSSPGWAVLRCSALFCHSHCWMLHCRSGRSRSSSSSSGGNDALFIQVQFTTDRATQQSHTDLRPMNLGSWILDLQSISGGSSPMQYSSSCISKAS